ncbi:hypothetical protein PVAG01_07217 [Phlyctema vagabunda]|uniref:DUF7820 domain-containing protein n=1 Tax=Phlyctema vagabunda TaxID=108571 RepID=A0ABR4PC82_9HELO
MATPNRRASSGVDRRASMRTSMRLSMQQDDEDEYALAAMGISDGFRPVDTAAGPQSASPDAAIRPRRSSPPPRPSSISKPTGVDSFALRHDGQMGPVSGMSGGGASSANRRSSIESENPYVRPESPYRGPTGPSHQYQMYSQESRLARTASVATSVTTTAPVVERNYTGPNGPTHPYGMYPQNTVPETETSNTPTVAPIPVGFPGRNNEYQRRLGPEGEEIAGIIGPDGHTEELPPYTQYPDEALARKTRPTVVAPVPAPVPAPVAGAGGMGLATRNPEFESREDFSNSPQSRQSTRSFTSDMSTHQVNTAAETASEKPELKKWQQVARRKVWGIVPVWVFVLVAIMLVLFGIILGSVFAALKPKDKPKHNNNGNHNPGTGESNAPSSSSSLISPTMTTTFDATQLSTVPVGLPTLPIGTFALPIQLPSTVQSSCLDNTAQSAAWSCNLPQAPLQVLVEDIPGTSEVASKEISLSLGNSSMPVFPYGAQPPTLSVAQVMSLVIDSQDTNKGPAWFFQLPYNKLVVLPESSLSTTSTSKREANKYNMPDDFMRRGVAQPGDKPWFCYWNGTLLEAFIYANLTSGSGSGGSSMSTRMMSTPTFGGGYPSPTPNPDHKFLPPYPKVVKVEERRVPSGAQTISPYCVQQVIDSEGFPSPAINSTGQQVRIFLNETESAQVISLSDKRDTFPSEVLERTTPLAERQTEYTCGCVWMFT